MNNQFNVDAQYCLFIIIKHNPITEYISHLFVYFSNTMKDELYLQSNNHNSIVPYSTYARVQWRNKQTCMHSMVMGSKKKVVHIFINSQVTFIYIYRQPTHDHDFVEVHYPTHRDLFSKSNWATFSRSINTAGMSLTHWGWWSIARDAVLQV